MGFFDKMSATITSRPLPLWEPLVRLPLLDVNAKSISRNKIIDRMSECN